MKRTIAIGLALATGLLGSTAPGIASAKSPPLPAARTELAQMDYGYGRDYRDGYGTNLEGRWVARRGYSLPASFGRGSRDIRELALPPRMVIDQRRNIVRVENLAGRVIQRIATGGRPRGDYIEGTWRNGRLVTVRDGYNARVVQTFSLTNGGRTLVVHTRQDAAGTRRDVEFTNVYQRT